MRTQVSGRVNAVVFALFITAATAHAAPVKPCELLNPPAASALFGGPLQPPVEMGTMCMYSSSAGPVITSAVGPAPGSAGPDFVKAKMGAGAGDTTESVPGLGDQNLFDMRPNGWNVLTVFYQQKMLVLSVQKRMNPALKDAMIQAALKMITKV